MRRTGRRRHCARRQKKPSTHRGKPASTSSFEGLLHVLSVCRPSCACCPRVSFDCHHWLLFTTPFKRQRVAKFSDCNPYPRSLHTYLHRYKLPGSVESGLRFEGGTFDLQDAESRGPRAERPDEGGRAAAGADDFIELWHLAPPAQPTSRVDVASKHLQSTGPRQNSRQPKAKVDECALALDQIQT